MLKSPQNKLSRNIDWILFAVASFLLLWGVFTIGYASFPVSLENYGNPWTIFLSHLKKVFVGIALGLILFFIPKEKLKKFSLPLFIVSFLSLIAVLFPFFGITAKGATRWLSLGLIGFQPVEFFKLAMIVYLAAFLSSNIKRGGQEKKGKMSIFVCFLLLLAIVGLALYLQKDLSTLVILCLIAGAMYFQAKTPISHSLLLAFFVFVVFAIFVLAAPFRMSRFSTFLNPEEDPLGRAYQINQSKIAVGSGGVLGVNGILSLGMSRQKFGFLPETLSDSVFAIIGEELGFVGCLFLLGLFLTLAFRGAKIAKARGQSFEGFLATGIIIWTVGQAFLNIAGATAIVPLAGIPLPFFSSGGSHIVAELMAIGLLLSVSKL